MDEKQIYAALRAPFPLTDLEWRVQHVGKEKKKPGDKALMLAYVTARAVAERLSNVLGLGGWSSIARKEQGGWICRIEADVLGKRIVHEDGAPETDIEGFKGGLSKSLVRTAVRLGVGAYLYDMPDQWVTLEGSGQFGYPPRNFRPGNLPPAFLPEKGPTGKDAVARVVDAPPPDDEPPPRSQPAGQPQPVGQVAAEMGVPTGKNQAAWEKIKWAHDVIQVPFKLSTLVDTFKEKEAKDTYVLYAEAALRAPEKRADSGHWSRMQWALDLSKHKDDAQWAEKPYYKRLKAISEWAEAVRDAVGPGADEPFDPLEGA